MCICVRVYIVRLDLLMAKMPIQMVIKPVSRTLQPHTYTSHTRTTTTHHPLQELPLHHYDTSLLTPVVAEHTVDERSPLYGHTHDSLEACGAEVVVTFEGVNELVGGGGAVRGAVRARGRGGKFVDLYLRPC